MLCATAPTDAGDKKNLHQPLTNKQVLELKQEGLYCPAGKFYIDPWRPVSHALITHAHSDHARSGHQHYLSHPITRNLLRVRLGQHSYQTINWGETIHIQGVQVSFHPAGHVAGSSQIRLEHKGERWVVSGDYKLQQDGLSGCFEPVKCNTFITESTFGLPVYKWDSQETIYRDMQQWILRNKADGICSVFFAYSLGKAQRVADASAAVTDRILLHHSAWNMHRTLVESGLILPAVLNEQDEQQKPDVIIAPLSVLNSSWLKKFSPYRTAICSGWMQLRGHLNRQETDTGFALSDHADWNALLNAIRLTGAEQVLVTHGYQAVLSRYLTEKGIDAKELATPYGQEEEQQVNATEIDPLI